MLRHAGILSLIYLCLVVQSSLVADSAPELGRPFLPAVTLVLIVAQSNPAAGIFWSGFLGSVLDFVSPPTDWRTTGAGDDSGAGIAVVEAPVALASCVAAGGHGCGHFCLFWRLLSQMTMRC